MTNPLKDYDECARAYLRAKTLLDSDGVDIEQAQQLLKILNSKSVGMTIIQGEQGPELDSIVSGLQSKIQEQRKPKLMPQTSTYALGVRALRDSYARGECPTHPLFTQDDGSKIVRPLTFKENLGARVTDHETLKNPDGSKRTKEERLKLFSSWLDSCTGIAYKKKSTKFKIIPVCKELILIDENSKQYVLPVDYNLINGVELNNSQALNNNSLAKEQVLEHPGWRAAVEEDLDLLRTYRDIVFSERNNPEKLMGFFIFGSNTVEDELRALCVLDLSIGSVTYNYSLDGSGSFLQVAHTANLSNKPSPEKTKIFKKAKKPGLSPLVIEKIH